MTKTLEEKEKFIQLRAQGMSFDRISNELNVSKPVLLKWNGEFLDRIKEAQFYELENIVEKYSLMRAKRFEVHSKLLSSALQELQERAESNKLKTLSTEKLFQLVEELEQRIEKDTSRELLSVPVDSSRNLMKSLHEEFIEIE